jgi:G3E family GTPase
VNNKIIKIGLIENEFGDVSIDSRLLSSNMPESIVELNNGCICCSIFNEFSLALQELVRKHDHLEQLIIETTGIADPGPIIEPFYQDADLMRLFELCGTICVVDAMHFPEQKLDFRQQKQIILSDLVVLNKIGMSDSKQLQLIHKRISALNKTVTVIECNFGRIECPQLHILQSEIQDAFLRKIHKPFYSEPDQNDFHSFTVRFAGFVNEKRFSDWFRYFASFHSKNIYRIKGIVNFQDSPFLGVVQAVGGTVSITEGSVVNPFDFSENVLVFIGKKTSKFEMEMEIGQFLLQEN